MVDEGRITAEEVTAVIERWAALEEAQAGLSGYLDIVAPDVRLDEPGTEWVGLDGLERRQLTRRGFFDESHEYSDVRIQSGADSAKAWTMLRWSARFRPEGSPVSRSVRARVEHEWELHRAPDGRVVVRRRTVDAFAYREGEHVAEEASAGCREHLPPSTT